MIEVGEYVRTEKGTIAKIEDIEWDLLYEIVSMKVKYKHWIDRNKCRTEYIVKHSKNITDLIEEGDYVNGYLIDSVEKFKDGTISLNGEPPEFCGIKSIVTHEQFKSIEYRVETEEKK